MDAETQTILKAESPSVLCAICNEFFDANDVIYTTSGCGHVFHKSCLFRWLSTSGSCPECRAPCNKQRANKIYLNFAERTEAKDVKRIPIQWVPIDLTDPLANFDLEGAVKCGTDNDGFDTYVARAPLRADMIPSNFVPEKRAVDAPFNWIVHHLPNADLLVLRDCELKWVNASNGEVPSNALETGYTQSGEALYTGRTIYDNRIVIGKIHPSWRCLFIPKKDVEVRIFHYEVLVVTPNEC